MNDFNYMSSIVEKIITERNKTVDSAILGEIQQIAVENGLETKIILNERNVAEALRNYQDGYAHIKAEVAREIFEEIENEISMALESNYKARTHRQMSDIANGSSPLDREFIEYVSGKIDALRGIEGFVEELKKKYTEGKDD